MLSLLETIIKVYCMIVKHNEEQATAAAKKDECPHCKKVRALGSITLILSSH